MTYKEKISLLIRIELSPSHCEPCFGAAREIHTGKEYRPIDLHYIYIKYGQRVCVKPVYALICTCCFTCYELFILVTLNLGLKKNIYTLRKCTSTATESQLLTNLFELFSLGVMLYRA